MNNIIKQIYYVILEMNQQLGEPSLHVYRVDEGRRYFPSLFGIWLLTVLSHCNVLRSHILHMDLHGLNTLGFDLIACIVHTYQFAGSSQCTNSFVMLIVG